MWGFTLGFLLGVAGELLAWQGVTMAGCGAALSTLFLLKVATRRCVLLGLGLSFAVVVCVVFDTGPLAVLTSTLLAIAVATRVLVSRSKPDLDKVGGRQHRRLSAAGIRAAESTASVNATEDRSQTLPSQKTGV